jgi:6-pyruvoyltetrahydropterin/6-carboxytetrahydropterin synthase
MSEGIHIIKTKFRFEAAHKLNLSYSSPCERLHGHGYSVTVWLASANLNDEGMVVDFTQVKAAVRDRFDHTCLNDDPYFADINSTAENMAEFIVGALTPEGCFMAEVYETENNSATYISDTYLAKLVR